MNECKRLLMWQLGYKYNEFACFFFADVADGEGLEGSVIRTLWVAEEGEEEAVCG